MNRETYQRIFEVWCKKLRLSPDWDVRLEWVEDPDWHKTGDFKVDCEDKKAILMLNACNPKQEENMEEIIVHELMHLKLYPLDQVTESLILSGFEEGSREQDFAYRQFFVSFGADSRRADQMFSAGIWRKQRVVLWTLSAKAVVYPAVRRAEKSGIENQRPFE